MATTAPDRILSLDLIRGLAVMGIFSVNVVGMGMLESAYFYPPDYGFDGLGDRIMWALNSIFVDGRFRSLFSILFGASMSVVLDRAVATGRETWKAHYPRMIVLMAFGAAHYYVLWWGDILVNYAIVGMIAFMFWRLPPKWLLAAAFAMLALHIAPNFQQNAAYMAKYEAGTAADAPPELRAKVQELLAGPSAEEMAEEIAANEEKNSSIAAHIAYQVAENPWRPWASVLGYGLETLGLMLIGMAGYRIGFLTGQWRARSYAIVAVAFLGADWLVHGYGAYLTLQADFAPQVYYPWIYTYTVPFHPIGALGYAALFMLLFPRRSAIADRFAAVGRAAFTNYLGATLIGTLLFSGTFLGMFGDFSRGELWLFAPPVWALMLLWSKWWLDRYRYGPFEWAWRCLARWRWEPMRRA